MLGRANILQADPAKVDAGIAFVRERVQPLVDSLPGSLGLGMYVDRETGVIVVNTVWADRAALDASEPEVQALRREAAEVVGATDARVEVHEPAVIWQRETDRPGFWSRAVELTGDPARVEEGIALMREESLPKIQQIPGVNTVVLLVNRETGHSVVNTTFRSRAEMEAAREQGRALREAARARLGLREAVVHELEVVIVGIRQPEVPAQATAPAERPEQTQV